MKNMKKFASVLVAIVLVLAMSVPAFAAGTGKITITNPVEGQTYKVYKMFSFTPASGSNEGGIYEALPEWESFISGVGATYLEVKDGTIVAKKGIDNAELAKAALAYAQDEANGVTAVSSKVAGKEALVFEDLEYGYYLVDSSLGALCALTTVKDNQEITEKNDVPELDKQVKEDSTGNWGEWNDADIGQEVEYKATITVGKGVSNYIMHDKMDAGLTYVGVTSVTVNGTDIGSSNYTVNTDTTDGCTFEVSFGDDYIATLEQGTEIVVEYKAKLNENAKIYEEGNVNDAWLEYGDNNETVHDKTTTYAYEFKLIKIDSETKEELLGAEFELYKDAACAEKIPVVKVTDGVYRVATDGEGDDVIEAGNVVIKGLDADKYYLKETKAPSGYNVLKDAKEITVNRHSDTVDEYIVAEITVENSTGSLLPETGGMGTTMFYVLGSLLVVGAAILLVTKKRMAYEA